MKPTSIESFSAFLFDMDGVVVNSMEYQARCWITVFAEYGINLTREDIFRREGMSGIKSIIDIFEEKKIRIPENDELHKLQEKKLNLFEKYEICLYPHAYDILWLIHNSGKPMALVTGSLRRSVDHVLPDEVKGLFRAIVTVDDITNGKPHPEPYLKALDKMDIKPGKVLAIENAPLGITSAKRAGLKCFALQTTLDSSYLRESDRIFTDHRSLYDYLRSMP